MSEVLTRYRAKFPAYDSRPDRALVLALGRRSPVYLARDLEFKEEFDRFERGEALRKEQVELQLEQGTSEFKELGGVYKNMGKLFARSVVESGLATPLEAIARFMSPGEQLADRADRGILNISTQPSAEDTVPFKLATALRQGVKDLMGEIDPDVESGFGTGTMPQALGSAVGFMTGSGALQLARVPALVGVASLGAASGGVEGYRRAKIAGADEETAMRSFALNSVVGSSEALPLAKLLSRLNKASGNVIGRALWDSTEEALQELFQAFSGNAIANLLTEEDVDLMEGALTSSSAGGLTGFILSLLVSGKGNFSAGRAARREQGRAEEQAQAEEQARAEEQAQAERREQQVEFAAANRRPAQETSEAQLNKLFGLDAPSENQKKPRRPRKPKPNPDTEQQRAFNKAPKTIFNEVFEKVYNDTLGGEFTPVSLEPDPKMQALARQLRSKQRRVALDEGGKLPSRGFGFDQITVEIDPSLENVPPPTAEELTFMVNQETMLAAQEMDASRKRRAELTGGNQLGSAVGATFSNLPVVPDFLKSAEQKVEKSEREQIVEAEVDAVDMNTPLKTVEDIVRSQLERRDFAAAVATLGNTPTAVSAQVIDETLGAGRDPVTLDAAERTIFNEIWNKVYTESQSKTPAAASVEDSVTLAKPSVSLSGLPPTQETLRSVGSDTAPDAATPPPSASVDTELWAIDPAQEFSSAETSINGKQLPATFNRVEWEEGTTNADIGGGKYDNATAHLETKGVKNIIIDPFNRSPEHNEDAINQVRGGQTDTATVSNVLNVIKEESARAKVIAQAADAIKQDGTAYFKIYNAAGDKAGPTQGGKSWQNRRAAQTYMPEIEKSFGTVTRRGDLIEATDPIKEGSESTDAPASQADTSILISGLPLAAAMVAHSTVPESMELAMAAASVVSLRRAGVAPDSNKTNARKIQAWIDTYVPRPNNEKVAVELDTSSVAPDLMPVEEAIKAANNAYALGRIRGLGWLFDPRARANTPAMKALILHAYDSAIGKGISSVMSQTMRGRIDGTFDMEGSKITNVTLVNPDAPLHISDFFEHYQENPRDYDLTQEQEESVELALSNFKEIQGLMNRNGITPAMLEDEDADISEDEEADISEGESYFPRLRLLTPDEKAAVKEARDKRGSGGSPSFSKSRYFKSEAEGSEAEITYEPSIEKRLTTHLAQIYKAIADKRLVDNPALKGETVEEKAAKMLEAERDNIAAGKTTVELVESKAREVTPGKDAKVNWRGLGKYFFPVKTAGVLNKAFEDSSNEIIDGLSSVNAAAKTLMLGADFAAPFLQGQMMAFSNPYRWTKAAGNHFKAWLYPDVMQRYLEIPENLRAMRELSQLGVSFGQLQDYMSGAGEGGVIPEFFRKGGMVGKGAASVVERFGRSFQTFNELAIIEMWKSQRDPDKTEDWPELAEALQNTLARGRREEIGISKGARTAGDLLFIAPSYLRGSVNVVVSALSQGGQSGKQARRVLGSWLLGMHLGYIAAGLVAGLDFEEILRRLNPDNSDHMMLPVTFFGARSRNIGIGGPVRSLMRLTGDVIGSLVRGDGKLSESNFSNPVYRWLRGKAAPIPSMAADFGSGADFIGNDIGHIEMVAARVLPLPLQTLKDLWFPKEGQPPAVLGELGLGVFGFQIWPENTMRQMAREKDKEARERGYSSFDTMPLGDRVEIHRKMSSLPVFEKTVLSEKNLAAGIKAGRDRAEALKEGLPTEARDKMNEWKLKVPGYDNALSFGRGQVLPLNQEQRERYGELIQARYNEVMPRLPWELLEKREKSVRQDVINSVLDEQKKVARGELLREMNATVEQPKPN